MKSQKDEITSLCRYLIEKQKKARQIKYVKYFGYPDHRNFQCETDADEYFIITHTDTDKRYRFRIWSAPDQFDRASQVDDRAGLDYKQVKACIEMYTDKMAA